MSSEHARALALLECAGIVQDGASAPLMRWRSEGDQYAPANKANGTTEIGFDEVIVRFEMAHGEAVDFIQLAIPAVAGRYLVTRCTVGGESLTDVARRVIAASERWAALPGGRHGIVVESASGRPWFEIDMRDFPAFLPSPASARTVEMFIRRQPPFAESAERLAAELCRIDASLNDLGARLVQGALGHDDALRRQFRVLDEMAQASATRHDALGAQARNDHAALIAAFVDRLEAIDTQLEALKLQTTSVVGTRLVRLAEQITALAAARESDDVRSSAALTALQAEMGRARHAIENVFWRRWLRRLTGRQVS